MARPVATIFGGSGFIGRYIVQRLARRGWILRIAVRRPDSALFLKPLGDVGQIAPIAANIRDDASVAAAVEGVDHVINLVGILYERGPQRFAAVHAEGARRVAAAAKAAGREAPAAYVGARRRRSSPSLYARTKAEGEAMVRAAVPRGRHPAPQRRLRARGRFLQPLRRDGALLARPAADRRRQDALPAGLCRRCRRCRRGHPRPAGGRALRPRRQDL